MLLPKFLCLKKYNLCQNDEVGYFNSDIPNNDKLNNNKIKKAKGRSNLICDTLILDI